MKERFYIGKNERTTRKYRRGYYGVYDRKQRNRLIVRVYIWENNENNAEKYANKLCNELNSEPHYFL